jgi:integrase/recombinase XerC
MLDSANRIGAIEKLTLSSLDLDDMVFNDIREKRGNHVQVIFLQRTKELIEEWLEMRKGTDGLKVDALFITKHRDGYSQMHKSTIQKRINKIGKIIGLDDFHAHCIRKTRLSSIYDETGDLALAAELGNHKSTETTRSFYIRPKSKTELRDKLATLSLNNRRVPAVGGY